MNNVPTKGQQLWYITNGDARVDSFIVDYVDTRPLLTTGLGRDITFVHSTTRLFRAGKKSIKSIPLDKCFANPQEALDHWRDIHLVRISNQYESMCTRLIGNPNKSLQI